MNQLGSGRLLAIAVATAMALLGAYLLWNSSTLIRSGGQEIAYFRSPAFFPRVCLVMFAGFSFLSAMREFSSPGEYHVNAEPFVHVGLLIGYALVLPLLGYFATSVLFVFIALALRGTTLVSAAIIAFATGTVLFLLFDVALEVWFPQSTLSSLFIR